MKGRELISYSKESEAKKAFLKSYCGESNYSRVKATERAGLAPERVHKWFKDTRFFDLLEHALKASMRNKSRIREKVIDRAIGLVDAQILDCFQTNPLNGDIDILPLHEIPERTRHAVKKLKLSRQKSKDINGEVVYLDVFDIELHDVTKALQILGTWTAIQAEEKKIGGEGKVQITGLTIIKPTLEKKELPYYAEATEDETQGADPLGEIFSLPEADGSAPETGSEQ